MFGSARTINGCPRIFPVNDYTLKSEVIRIVQSKDGRRAPPRFNARDLRFVQPNSIMAINVAGRQGHLFLTTYGGRAITFLVHAAAGEVSVVPLRFLQARHDPGTLLRCTFSPKDRLLVLDDVCSEEPLANRVNDLHVLVHTDHTPDPFMFPLRVVARRFFALSQAPEVKKLVHKTTPFKIHSVSVIDTTSSTTDRYVEKRIMANVGTQRFDNPAVSVSHPVPDQCTSVAMISRGSKSEPEAYRVSVDEGASWDHLCVKTIAESLHLARVFTPSTPAVDAASSASITVPCVVISDGGKWRFLGVRAESQQ